MPPTLSITAINTERLFEELSYDLSFGDLEGPIDKLAILHGDNGSGKTTLLKLIYNVLSMAPNRGHMSFLARTPFRAFSVELSDGTVVKAERAVGELVGNFSLRVEKASRVLAQADFVATKTEENELIIPSDYISPEVEHLRATLGAVPLTVFLLSDDRSLSSDVLEDRPDEIVHFASWQMFDADVPRIRRKREVHGADAEIRRALRRTEMWIRSQALQGTNLGEKTLNQHYTDMVRQIVDTPWAKEPEQGVKAVAAEIETLQVRSEPFTNLGLSPPIDTAEIVRLLKAAKTENAALAAQAARAYIQALSSRLDALEAIQKRLSLFVDTINGFLLPRKHIKVDVTEGIKIHTRKGLALSPSRLSSGERQLVLLFCNTLTASEKASVFLIDEPETLSQYQVATASAGPAPRVCARHVDAVHSCDALGRVACAEEQRRC
jgi:ABC-type sugar transport system ATPase subunit